MTKNIWILLLGVGFLGVALVISYTEQSVSHGDTVTVNYTIMLEDGTVYYSSIGREPLKATLGQGTLLPGFEEEVIGMRVGDTKTFTLPPEQAYGNYRPEMIGTFDRSRLPEGVEPEIGKQIQANLKDGTQTIAIITSFTGTTVTLDANHPLAGHSLTFDIKLMTIETSRTPFGSDPAIPGWLILALGMAGVGFLFYKTRNRPGSNAVKKRMSVISKHF